MSDRKIVYDAGSDVLYVCIRSEVAASAHEDADGVVWRYGADGQVIGITIPSPLRFQSDD